MNLHQTAALRFNGSTVLIITTVDFSKRDMNKTKTTEKYCSQGVTGAFTAPRLA